jgi:beta-phosphoglucomutase
MFDTVIFDWDGTLADTKRVIVASFQNALREIQCEIGNEFIERRIGIGSAETFREILRYKKVKIDQALIVSLVRKKIATEIEMDSKIRLFEGATELLESLQGRVKLGLASSNNRDVIEHSLQSRGIRKLFDTVITAEDLTKPKPNPEIFLKCAIKLTNNPRKCVVIEDSIFGVVAAKTAGMSCIAVLTGVYSKEDLSKSHPDLILNSLIQQREIFEFIFK